MATLSQHISARNDADLLDRFTAAAEVAGIENPQGWAEAHRGELVAADVADGQNIADVYAYAVATYAPTPRPGVDSSKVTDDLIVKAVSKVNTSE